MKIDFESSEDEEETVIIDADYEIYGEGQSNCPQDKGDAMEINIGWMW